MLATAAFLAGIGAAKAAETFTWTPHGVGLNGSAFTADTLVLGDYARITFGFDGPKATFLDKGFMPILGFKLQGQHVPAAGFNAADGTGWGAYIDYTARGVQNFAPNGVPVSATFTELSYSIFGYNGLATFSLDGGTPMIGGTMSQVTTLGTGTLIGGQLSFLPVSPTSLAIVGDASTTLTGVPPGFSSDALTRLDVHFEHQPDEYEFLRDPPEIQISGKGEKTTAAFVADVPEPGTAVLVGAGLLGLGALRRRQP